MCKDAYVLVFFFLFYGVGIFKLVFLRHYLTIYIYFWDHWKGNFLGFLKITSHLILVHSWELQRALTWKNYFLRGHPLAPSKGHQITSKAYFIKWTTSGEPPVGSKSLWHPYIWSNKHMADNPFPSSYCPPDQFLPEY